MKKKNQILRLFFSHQLFGLGVILAAFLLVFIVLLISGFRSDSKERLLEMKAAANAADVRMDNIESALTELYSYTLNNGRSLWGRYNTGRYFAKVDLYNRMKSRRESMPEIDLFFCYQPDESFFFQNDSTFFVEAKYELMEYLKSHVSEMVTTWKKNSWHAVSLQYGQYLGLCYYYPDADLYLGVFSETESLMKELNEILISGTGTLSVTDSSGNVLQREYGDEILKRQVDFDDLSFQDDMDLSCSVHVKNSLNSRLQLYVILAALAAVAFCLVWIRFSNRILKQQIITPIDRLSYQVQQISEDGETEAERRVTAGTEVEEISLLEEKINQMLHEVVFEKMGRMNAELHEKEQELRLMQAQIRPHFYLNAIMTVNALTYQDRDGDIRTFLQELSEYIRYMIRFSDREVTLREELENVDNYFRMQEIRYPGKTVLFTECSDELYGIRIPHMMLLTLVENCFRYAMNLEDLMQVYIQAETENTPDFCGAVISIEDNGPGMSPEMIRMYNDPEIKDDVSQEHVGLMNIKKTLELKYGRKDLLTLENVVPHGARVSIRIPIEEEETDENTDRG